MQHSTSTSAAAILAKACMKHSPNTASKILERHHTETISQLLNDASAGTIVGILSTSLPLKSAGYLETLDEAKGAEALAQLNAESALQVFRHMHKEKRDNILKHMSESKSSAYHKLLEYPHECAGAFMDPFVTVLPSDISVKDAMKYVRSLKQHSFYFPYVVNRSQELVGIITVRSLMLASPKQTLGEIMQSDVMKIRDTATTQDLVHISGLRSYLSMPVVDSNNIFLGVLRKDALEHFSRESKRRNAPNIVANVEAVSELYMHLLTSILHAPSKHKK